MKLAASWGHFSEYCPTPAEAVKFCAGSGFRLLDMSFTTAAFQTGLTDGSWKAMVKEPAEAARRLGFSFVQAHSPVGIDWTDEDAFEKHLEATKRSIEACGMLGIPHTVVEACFQKGAGKEAFFERNRLFYRALFPEMERYGVSVLIENTAPQHTQGRYYFITGADMREFIRFVGHPMLHAVWDTGHGNMTMRATGQSQRENILALGDELYGLHVHGNNGLQDDHLAPFIGWLDMDDIMPALLEIRYKGTFTFEADFTVRLSKAFPGRQDLSEKDELFRRVRDISVKSVSLLYDIGRCILEEYGCFEM